MFFNCRVSRFFFFFFFFCFLFVLVLFISFLVCTWKKARKPETIIQQKSTTKNKDSKKNRNFTKDKTTECQKNSPYNFPDFAPQLLASYLEGVRRFYTPALSAIRCRPRAYQWMFPPRLATRSGFISPSTRKGLNALWTARCENPAST